jgi:hypothetical protein
LATQWRTDPLSTAAATAISSIANPRRHPAVKHDPPAVAGRALSARRKGSSSGPAKLPWLPKLLSSSSVIANRCLPTHLPPAPRSSVRWVVFFASPLLRFSMIYKILILLLLLGFCLFCSVLVFVINFVLGFAVQLASISTKPPSSVAYVGL